MLNTNTNTNTNTNNTKKQRTNASSVNKKELWSLFDTEVENKQKKIEPLECMYRTCGDRENCDACGYILAYSDEGYLTCTNNRCGIIYKDKLDQTAEWRFYGADDNQFTDPTRCGMPTNPLLKESSFGCKVLLNGSYSYEMRKLKRYVEWQSMPYKEKSQYDDFQFITNMAQHAGIPKMIIDDALRYYKKISEQEVTFRGDNRDGILAASIYISCRINNYPRTAKEIANIFHLNITSATKGCKNAMSIVNQLERELDNNEKTVFTKTKPDDFIDRYCSKLNMNKELTKLCKFVSIKVEKMNLMPENTPHSTATGIVYFIAQICNLSITKRDVKLVSDISEVTINKCYKKLEGWKDQLVPKVILQKYGDE
jgi:transcription initiation factor TFIIB